MCVLMGDFSHSDYRTLIKVLYQGHKATHGIGPQLPYTKALLDVCTWLLKC